MERKQRNPALRNRLLDFLEGSIETKQEGHIVLRTGGIGWAIAVPQETAQTKKIHENLKLFLHLSVGDHAFNLYGFATIAERTLFRQILGVGGIGPMSALALLSSLGFSGVTQAIVHEDLDAICSAKGIGKKTAERILVDLRNALTFPTDDSALPSTPRDDLIKVLDGLGFSPNEARASAEAARRRLGQDAPLEDLLKNALHEKTL